MVTLKLTFAEAQRLQKIVDEAQEYSWPGISDHDVEDLADKLERAVLEESIERRRILREVQS